MLQTYNNKFLSKFEGLDFLNMFLSILIFGGLVAEVTLTQLISEGNNVHFVVNKSNLGYHIVSEKKKKKKQPSNMIVVVDDNNNEPQQTELRKAIFKSFKQRNFVTKFMGFWMMFFAIISLVSFSIAPCGINTFDTG